MSRPEQALERAMAKAVIAAVLKAGYLISVNDGEETTLRLSMDASAILDAMFSTDEDRLFVHLPTHTGETEWLGWVYFIYGNDGWDVVNDYTTNLEPVLRDICGDGENTLSDRLERGEFEIVFQGNELLQAAKDVMEWQANTGGWEAPCWGRLKAAINTAENA